MIYVDSHVHLYDCFDLEILLDSALKNFRKAAEQTTYSEQKNAYVLLLTEGNKENWFKQILAILDATASEDAAISKNWRVRKADNTECLMVWQNDSPDSVLYIVAGRQVVTKERIEVLGLYTGQTISDGLSLADTVATIQEANAIPVLPWGVGKWFGTRGETIKRFLTDYKKRTFYLGDNGGRPGLWPTPTLFGMAEKNNISVLPGTDALPISSEASRVGSFGFYIEHPVSQDVDAASYLKSVLLSQDVKCTPFGSLQNSFLFLINQLRLRFQS